MPFFGTGVGEMMILSGRSHPELSGLIESRFKKSGIVKFSKKENGEIKLELEDSVRGKDIYIIQTGTRKPDDDIIELMILAYTCRTNCARRVIGVVPYLPYSRPHNRQCRQKKRGGIVTSLLAKMFKSAGFSHLITLDLHRKEIQGFFDFPVDNLVGFRFLTDYIASDIPDFVNAVIVARHPNQVKRATSFASRLHINIAVVHGGSNGDGDDDDGNEVNKDMIYEDNEEDEGSENSDNEKDDCKLTNRLLRDLRRLRPTKNGELEIVGDVNGKIAIIVEDIVDDLTTFTDTIKILREHGAYKIYIIATHGILGPNTMTLVESLDIAELVVTNSIPNEAYGIQSPRIKIVDISPLLTEAIRRTYNQESMSSLFREFDLPTFFPGEGPRRISRFDMS
ncbi:hypothetical protein ACOME3_009392 [Neoechinorhynchus agilis]